MLALAVICSSVSVFRMQEVTVEAREDYSLYPMACNAFEVDELENNGTFKSVMCTSDYNAAVEKMNELKEGGVIRHKESYSPTKIINMYDGVVYSYPQRSKKNTAVIDQYIDGTKYEKTTYVTVHREMRYKGVASYDPASGNGKVHIVLTGFDGYIDLKNCDLVPMKAVTNNIALYLGGNSTYDGEEPFRVFAQQGYFKAEQNGNYTDLVYHCFSGWADPDGDGRPAEWTFRVGPAAEWMSEGSVYYSDDGYTFYNDRSYSSQAGIYYSYYMFLPLRTRSSVSRNTFNRFLEKKGKNSSSKLWDTADTFLEAQEKYGMNALAVFAMACMESSYGTSRYAVERNNLFGWTAYDSDPDSASWFPSVTQAINEQMAINLRGYINIDDIRYFGSHLGNKGSGVNVKYAGDPYWGMKIAAIAYEIDKTDNGSDGTLTDFNSVSFGIVADDRRTDILKAVKGEVLYNTAYGATYQKNHTLAVLGAQSDWYQVQSTSPLDENGNIIMNLSKQGMLDYDWNAFTGWIRADEVTMVNSRIVSLSTEASADAVETCDSSVFKDGKLILSGKAYWPSLTGLSATQTLRLQTQSLAEVQTYPAESSAEKDIVTWKAAVDLASLENGTYLFSLASVYEDDHNYDHEYYLPGDFEKAADSSFGGKTFHLDAAGDEEKILTLTVSDISCGRGAVYDSEKSACVCVTGYENWAEGSGCTVKASQPDDMLRSVSSAEVLEDAVLALNGTAFIEGMNASTESEITHTLILVSLTDGVETEIPAETSDAKMPIDFGDGYDYTRIAFRALIDLNELDPDDYYLAVRVTNGEETRQKALFSNKESVDLPPVEINGYSARMYASQVANNRMELDIEKNQTDLSVINKPYRRASTYSQKALTLEGSRLTIDGTAFIFAASMTEKDHPVTKVLLVGEDGAVHTFAAENQACAADPAEMLGLQVSLSNSCFALSADLSELDPGVYRVYLDVQTDSWHDIYEMYNYRPVDASMQEVESRTYSLTADKVRSRYLITVTDTGLEG